MYTIDQYIVTVEAKDRNGKIELRAATLDNEGPMATGYPCWTIFRPKYFTSIQDAEDFFYRNKKYLMEDIRDRYVPGTIKIQKYTLEYVKDINTSDSIESIEAKRQDEADYAEYIRLKEKFERSNN